MPGETQYRPLVLVGMHRSGTSLAAWLLERSGVFMGWRNYRRTCENPFFVQLNSWILRQGGVEWDHPDPIPAMCRVKPIRDLVQTYVDDALVSPAAMRFTGPLRWLAQRDLRRSDRPWGFKDPRTTLTLPFWREALPNARWLLVTRHGVDVAESLRSRWHRHSLPRLDRYRRRTWFYRMRRKRIGAFMASCADLDSAYRMWEAYTDAAERNLAGIPAEDRMEVRYEDLLLDPLPGLTAIVRFAGLDLPEADLRAAVEDVGVNASRAYAYRNRDELAEFAASRSVSLEQRGYSADGPASTSPSPDRGRAAESGRG